MNEQQQPPGEAEAIDWSLATFEGARREQLRRWSELPLRQVILALEEMQELAERLGDSQPSLPPDPVGK